MSKKPVIKKSSEIRTILQTGKQVSHPLFKITYLPTAGRQTRWAILIGKRYGGAVDRNKIKRQMREILRHVTPDLRSGFDLLMMPKRAEKSIPFRLLKEKVQFCFRQEGLL